MRSRPSPPPLVRAIASLAFLSSWAAATALPADAIRIRGQRTEAPARAAEFSEGVHWSPGTTRGALRPAAAGERIAWWVETGAEATFDVSLVFACGPAAAGTRMRITGGGASSEFELGDTGDELRTVPLGPLALGAGVARVVLERLGESGAPDGEPETVAGTSAAPRIAGLVFETGFRSLFDGAGLEGWDTRYLRGPGYAVEDGALVCVPEGGGNLYTEDEYGDFVLRFEFRLDRCSNNGLGIRLRKHPEPPKILDGAYHGLEIQILDNACPRYHDRLQPWQYHGSVYGVIPAERGHLRSAGRWNVEEVVARGSRIAVRLNGATIVDGDLEGRESNLKNHVGLRNERGYIGFLGHGSRVAFRDIRIRPLEE